MCDQQYSQTVEQWLASANGGVPVLVRLRVPDHAPQSMKPTLWLYVLTFASSSVGTSNVSDLLSNSSSPYAYIHFDHLRRRKPIEEGEVGEDLWFAKSFITLELLLAFTPSIIPTEPMLAILSE